MTVPPLLADIIQRSFAPRLKIRALAHIASRRRIEMQVRRWKPDIVLIKLRRGEDDSIGRSIIKAVPRATVIAISASARDAYVHEMAPHRTVLTNVSRGDLIEQISHRISRS